jgi:hypothetical protein
MIINGFPVAVEKYLPVGKPFCFSQPESSIPGNCQNGFLNGQQITGIEKREPE